MIQVSLQTDLAKAVSALIGNQRKQLPFATAVALTRSAQVGLTAINSQVRAKVDRPTPATLRAFELVPAQKKDYPDSFAAVKLRDTSLAGLTRAQRSGRGSFTSGIPYSIYLKALFEGGVRRQKPFEKRLVRAGVMPADNFAVPGSAAQLDRFGNIPRGQITLMLSQVKSFNESGYDANVTEKSAKRGRRRGRATFFVWRRGGVPLGIGMRSRGKVGMFLVFVRRPGYQRRVDFAATVERVSKRALPAEFKRAMEQALRTAR